MRVQILVLLGAFRALGYLVRMRLDSTRAIHEPFVQVNGF